MDPSKYTANPPSYAATHSYVYDWQPGTVRRAPRPAIFAIFLAILCVGASAVIIGISDQRAATWQIQPSVLLGFLASLTAAMLVVSLCSGVVVTWWRAALDPQGTTMAKLHYIWNYGPMGGGGATSAWMAGKHTNKIAIASMLTAVASIAYSPLLQRASHIGTAELATNVTFSLDVLPVLPDGFTGTVDYTTNSNISAYWDFSDLLQEWYNGNPPYQPAVPCNGTCVGFVPSAGISSSCTKTKSFIDLPTEGKAGVNGFSTNFRKYEDADSIPTLEMKTTFIDSVDEFCNATLFTNVCQIQAGTVDFPIIITNLTILPDDDFITNFTPRPSLGDLSTAEAGAPAGPLAGLVWAAFLYFESVDTIYYLKTNTTSAYTDAPSGLLSLQWFDYSYNAPPNSKCPYRWLDPSEYILDSFSEILFWAAMAADTNGSVQSFIALQSTNTLVYTSVYSYLAVGSFLVAIALFAVSYTLYGFWQLGRDVSMSPLETAKAFGAPVFQDPSLHPDGEHLAKDMGKQKFRYGVVRMVDGQGVQRPTLGFVALGAGSEAVESTRAENG
jgi:Protein of unknown function (DUF3176)